MSEDRLQKILARAGLGSRRAAEETISEGRVTVNGRVATLGDKADPERDAIKVDGKRLHPPKEHHYLLLNKPRAVMSTASDPEGRPTVLELVPPGLRKAMVPVGRLDFLTEGLILLTDDGDFAQRVAHPRYGCTKTYEVKVRGTPDARSLERLRRGIVLEGERTRPAAIDPRPVKSDTGNSWWIVELGQGRTRQIREMFKRIGHPVMKLRRVAIGPVRDPDLAVGQVRELTEKEVEMLRRAGKHRVKAQAAKARAEQEGAERKGPKKGKKRKKATGKKHEGEAVSRAAGKSVGRPAGKKAGTKPGKAAGKKGKAAPPHRRETEAAAEPRATAMSGPARDRRPPGSGRGAEGEAVQGSNRRRSGAATGGGEEAAERPRRGAPGHTGGDRRARRSPAGTHGERGAGGRAGGEAGEAREGGGRGAGGRRTAGRGGAGGGRGGSAGRGTAAAGGRGGKSVGGGGRHSGGGKTSGGSGRKPGGGGGRKPSAGSSGPGGRGGKGGRGGSGGRGGGGRR